MSNRYNLISWNVNGLRAAIKKDFLELLLEKKYDIVCIQETKVSPDKLPREAKNIPGYYNYFVSAEPHLQPVLFRTVSEEIEKLFGMYYKKYMLMLYK